MKSGLQSEVFEGFASAARSISNPELEKWKGGGGKVLGYTCSFVPEELIVAAGLMPFRIRGTGSLTAESANEYFEAANVCSFIRHTFDQVLQGRYDFLDGAVIGGGCDANRHIYDNWQKSPVKPQFLETIFFPHASGEPMALEFRGQLAGLKTKIEQHFGAEITDEKLRSAVRLCNETRSLQRDLYALRQSANPPITGGETVEVMVAGSSMPKERYNTMLRTLLEELRGATVPERKIGARIMIVGPGHDDTSMCDIVEELGGLVAADLTCFGGKVIFGSVQEEGPDPLQAIADYQVLARPFCPKNLGAHPHIQKELLDQVRALRVDGVIGQSFLCCNMWGGELYILHKELKEAGIPMLRLEREYVSGSSGQLQTRVQAFLETISGGGSC